MGDDTVQTSLGGSVETKLVNVSNVGRTGVTLIGRSSKYGSPFKLNKDGGDYNRQESVRAFREYWYSEECDALRDAAQDELAGETIGCYCIGEEGKYPPDAAIATVKGEPSVCHGEVILQFINETTP